MILKGFTVLYQPLFIKEFAVSSYVLSELTSTDTADSASSEQSDNEAADGYSKADKSQSIKQILGNRGLNVVTDETPDILLVH